MKPAKVLWFVVLLLVTADVSAQAVVSRACRQADGTLRWVDGGGPCPALPSAPASSGGMNSMAPALGAGAYGLGYALGSALRNWGNDNAEEAQRQEQARQAAQQRLEQQLREQQAREAAEHQRQREQMYSRVMNALGLNDRQGAANSSFDGNNLGLLGIGDSRVVDLRSGPAPSGTGFFGDALASSPFVGYDLNDPNVVDLRNLQNGYALATATSTVPAAEAAPILDEALRVAMGEAAPVIKVPPRMQVRQVSDEGLLAFQRASIAYARERDGRARLTEIFNEAQERRRLARQIADRASDDYEKTLRAATDHASFEQKRKMMADIFAAAKAEDEAEAKARRILERAKQYEGSARDEAIRVLKEGALSASITSARPVSFPASNQDPAFQRLKQALIDSRERFEVEIERVVRSVQGFQIPKPTTFTQVHEGVVLGMFTDPNGALQLKNTGTSPFSGQKFSSSNAVIVSFGRVPGNEVARVVGDHLFRGQVSVESAQGRQAVEQLSGKSFDRVLAHSNGAMIVEALLREDLIKVTELNILGGDRALANGPGLQKLIDTGKVQRVVVWTNLNDPVPWISSTPDLNVHRWSSAMTENLVRRLSDAEPSRSNTVEYRYMTPRCRAITFECHYLESTYFPEIAKVLGTQWSASASQSPAARK